MRAGQEDPTKDWDPWFNVDTTRLTTQTYASFGTTIKTRVGPPLYCKDPSPGLHEYVNGAWQLHPMGQPRSALPNGGPGGMSLGCAPVPQPLQKRRDGARERQEEKSLIAASKENKREIKKRSTAGSLLNVNVYQHLPMCSSNDDYDPCDAKPCNYYDDDGNLFPADCCPSPTPSPTTTTTNLRTNTNPPITTNTGSP